MNIDVMRLAPYAWRAFQQRARLGLLGDDLEALWNAAQPLLAELTARWPAMNRLARTTIAQIAPEFADKALAGLAPFEPDLLYAQHELKARGYYNGPMDGKNGPATVDAIERFQRAAGFDAKNVDGLWGPVTAGALMAS